MQHRSLVDQIEEAKQALEHFEQRCCDSLSDGATTDFTEALGKFEEIRQQICELDAEVEQTEKNAAHDRNLCEQFVDLAPEAYVITNQKGIIEFSNKSAARLLGQPPELLPGKPLAIFIANKDLASFFRPMVQIRRQLAERIDNVLMQVNGAGKEQIYTSISVAAIKEASGAVLGIRWFIRDISEQVEHETEIQRLHDELQLRLQDLSIARDQATEAVRAKSQFIANMSHELRTPLNGVVGMTDFLMSSTLDNEQLESTNIIRDCAKRILALVEDVLDLSKMDVGSVGLHNTDFDIIASLEDTVSVLAEQASQKGLSLMTYVDPQVPQVISGDMSRISQVLLNLLSNAIKFTDHGEVALKVTVSPGLGKIRFYVIDTGEGLSELDIKRLFKPFSQVDSSNTRHHGGTGLGLYISKSLVELMGGQIGVFSNNGKGSTFWFTLPLETGAKKNAIKTISGLESGQVVVVSCLRQCRDILTRSIRDWGVNCLGVASHVEADALIPTARCELVIVDLRSPDPDIRAWLKESSERGYLRQKKVILIANNSEEARTAVGTGTFHAYLSKPVRASQLYECLQGLSNSKTSDVQSQQRGENTQSISQQSRSPAVFRDRGELILVADDNAVNQRVMSLLLKKLGFNCDLVSNGEEAVKTFLSRSHSLILMDCQMPIVDGYQATARIRRHEGSSGRHVPIIAFTASAMPEDREKCLAAGMDDYISKPVTIERLKSVVSRWLTNLRIDSVS